MEDRKNGFSLVELIVTIAIVSFLSLAIFGLYSAIVKAISHYRERATIATLADNYLEIARNLAYERIGTINGNPSGNLPDSTNPLTVTVDRRSYKIYYVVNTISNDPINDPSAQNYKQVKLYVEELTSGYINTFVTTISTNGNPIANVGALTVKVYNAIGQSLSAINVHIINTSITPNINLCRITDSTGTWNEAGLPCSATLATQCSESGFSGYHVVINDPACSSYDENYSSNQTYSAIETSPSIPTQPDATVYYNQASYLDFQIDKISNLTFNILDGTKEECDPISGIGIEVRGAKKIGITPNLYKYDKSSGSGISYSNSDGEILLSGVEWDSYTPALLGTTRMIYGTSPMQPFFLLPDSDQQADLIVGPYTANSLLVTVRDVVTKDPISGASVNLGGVEQITGSVLQCADVQSPGQTMFAGLSSGLYNLAATAAGYQEKSISNLDINGYSAITMDLIPTGGQDPGVTYVIKSSLGTSGGTISPLGNIIVNEGDNKTFAIVANTGFTIHDIVVDNVSQGALSTYTFNNVTSDHTISAVFSSVSPDCTPGSTQSCVLEGQTGIKTCPASGIWADAPCVVTGTFFCMISDAGGNWNSASTWTDCNGTYPQNGDSIVASATSGNLVINTQTASLKSFDLTNYSGILSGNSNLIIAPASGTVNVIFSSTMTNSYTGNMYLRPASGVTMNFTTNGKTIRGWILQDSGTGTIQQQDDITNSGSGIQITGSVGGKWYTNDHNITLTAGAPYFYAYNATFYAGTGTVSFTSLTGTGTVNTSSANAFYNFSAATTGASGALTISSSSGISVTNSMSLNGNNSTSQRLFVVSSVLGTQRRIAIPSTINFSNVDFRDIDIYSSGGQVDLSNISGLSGDCGGNNQTDAKFTSATDQHWTNVNGGTWSTVSNWTSRVPLCQDSVFMDIAFGSGKTVTGDVSRMGSLDWSGVTWSGALTWNYSVAPYINGSLKLKNGMTLNNSNTVYMAGRGAYNLITDGVTIPGSVAFYMGDGSTIGVGTGSLAIQDNLTLGNGRAIYLYSGTVTNPNNSTIRSSYFTKSGGNLTMCDGGGGSCTWYFSNNSTSAQTIWNINGTNATFNSSGSTIDISNNASPASPVYDVLTLYGLTYNNITIHGDSGNKGVSFSNHNNTLTGTLSVLGKKTIIFQQGTVQNLANFSGVGTDGNYVTIKSNLSGTGLPGVDTSNFYFTFNKTGGGVISGSDYISLWDSHATPSSTWYAGNNSIDNTNNGVSSNAGWIFTIAP